jgi:hypothetical protein
MFLPYQTQPGSGLSWYGVGKRIYPSNNTTLVDAGTATSSRHESVPRFCHPRCDILSVQQGAGGTRPREHYGALRPLATKKMWLRNAALHLQLQFVPSSEPTTTRAALCMRALQAKEGQPYKHANRNQTTAQLELQAPFRIPLVLRPCQPLLIDDVFAGFIHGSSSGKAGESNGGASVQNTIKIGQKRTGRKATTGVAVSGVDRLRWACEDKPPERQLIIRACGDKPKTSSR